MTQPYAQLTHDQLLSALTERDDQLRVALGDRDRFKNDFELQAGWISEWKRVAEATQSQLHASQERCKELEGGIPKAYVRMEELDKLHSDLTTHKTVLKECASALEGALGTVHAYCGESNSTSSSLYEWEQALTHATTLLEKTEPPLDRIKELEK